MSKAKTKIAFIEEEDSEANELANKYQQKTDKQHILDNPDTYIGSIENVDADMWIMNDTGDRIIEKNIKYIPGLFKLFDEGIVNCRDHVVRMQTAINNNVPNSIPVSYIDVGISEDGTITMINDGNGIDVAEHPETKLWIPEMIFGHLRTSTNYNKDEKKIVGGKNGFGFKLVLIWSTYGYIETIDHVRGLKYCQEFKNNLDTICKPSITKCSKSKPYTKIVFKPDYKRLGLNGLDSDLIALLKKRVFDISAVTDKTLKVKYNSQLIPTKNFQQYVDLYIGAKGQAERVYEEPEGGSGRWEYAVALTPTNEFVQVSFVNGIHTSKGGKHVDYIMGQITKKLCELIEKKKKVKVNPNSIKEQLILFLRCDIENPAFDSQTKDFMNTPMSKFGSKCEVSDKFIEKVAKMGVMDAAVQITEVKENKVAKKTDGTKSKRVTGIPKLTDANFAGKEKSHLCSLILCEGDSAKSGIISGLSSEDRDIIGVYPLKGKVMNVRGENVKKINENKEIAELKKIIGLESGRKYNDMNDVHKYLRYSKIIFMTDQDLDGSHIKGLCINLFQCEWSTLCEIPGFICFMNTPILKAKKGKEQLNFYNDGEYNTWKQSNNDGKGWNIKYYKGLGTSTGKEFKEYFQEKKYIGFSHSQESDNAIDMVFNKKRADDRKDWLNLYDRNSYLDTNNQLINYEEFINKEFIHFSKYDCDRSIPNLMDGLKISLRKILFSAFKKNLTSEIKVAQFSGYVSEQSCYHHGEASLNKAIVGMAQNFVGSNNINMLVPSGQFGTRLEGGNDSASERYIFTYLNPITRLIFNKEDDIVLKYLNDDGHPVEPLFYVPIIPMVLVNGSKGIGTGFSTDIMCYNPQEIIQYIKNKLENKLNNYNFVPYYQGFKGQVIALNTTKYMFKGCYTKIGPDKIRVTELPVGFWTQNFKEYLEELLEPVDKEGKKLPAVIKEFDDMSKDTNVEFVITFPKGKLEELESINDTNDINGVEKLLKLTTTNTTTNMNLFDAEEKLKKYENVSDIIDDYFETRLVYYDERKDALIDELEKDLVELSNRARYIKENLAGTIDLRKKKKEQIIKMLQDKDYDIINNDDEYKYLVKMPMDSVSEENVAKLLKEHGDKEAELERIKMTTIQQMWLTDLQLLEKAYQDYLKERNAIDDSSNTTNKKKISSSKVVVKSNKKKMTLLVEEDSEVVNKGKIVFEEDE
jgi:DNA topoisomerase-2